MTPWPLLPWFCPRESGTPAPVPALTGHLLAQLDSSGHRELPGLGGDLGLSEAPSPAREKCTWAPRCLNQGWRIRLSQCGRTARPCAGCRSEAQPQDSGGAAGRGTAPSAQGSAGPSAAGAAAPPRGRCPGCSARAWCRGGPNIAQAVSRSALIKLGCRAGWPCHSRPRAPLDGLGDSQLWLRHLEGGLVGVQPQGLLVVGCKGYKSPPWM